MKICSDSKNDRQSDFSNILTWVNRRRFICLSRTLNKILSDLICKFRDSKMSKTETLCPKSYALKKPKYYTSNYDVIDSGVTEDGERIF